MIYSFLIIAILLLTAGHLFQVARWRQFITIYEQPTNRTLLQSLSIGYFFNFFIPFRLGDFFRAIYAGKKMNNGISFALATVIVGRYLDVLAVGLFFFVFVLLGNFEQQIISSAIFYGVTSLVVFILSLFFLKNNTFPKWIIRKFSSLFNQQIELRILIFFWCFITSFKDMYLKTNRVKLLLNTLLMWFFYISSYYMLALTINLSNENNTEFLDVFVRLFSRGGIEMSDINLSVYALTEIQFIGISFLLLPLLILFSLSFFHLKKDVLVEDGANYFNLLPHKNKEDKLAFLELYFSTHDSDLIKKYLEITNEVLVLEDFSAGSNATTLLCFNNNKNFFRKYAIGPEKDKLYVQIEWLNHVSKNLPVTTIIDFKLTDDYCYYDMEYSPTALSLFNYIHTANSDDSWKVIHGVLELLRVNLHSLKNGIASEHTLDTYIDTKILKNLDKIKEKKSIKELLKYDDLIINGKTYKNLHKFSKYLTVEHLKSVFKEDVYTQIHGDLTIENIIVDKQNENGFYLIDSNSENIHNTDAIDFAKLLQSLHGGYEFLMKSSNISVNNNNISFLFVGSARYEDLYQRYKLYLNQNFSVEKVKSIFYHEIVHWLRLLPYKFEKNEQTALLFYAGFIIILNDVINEFEEK